MKTKLTILLLFLHVISLLGQQVERDLLIGFIGDNLVKVDAQTGDTEFITKINFPPNGRHFELTYSFEDCLFYSINNPTDEPEIIAFDWDGNIQSMNRLRMNGRTIFTCESLAFNWANGKLYAGGSLDGQDFFSESLMEVDRNTGEATLVSQLEIPGVREDFDNISFENNILYLGDGDPAAGTTTYYRIDFATVTNAPIRPELLFVTSYVGSADMTVKDGFLFFPGLDPELYSFDINQPRLNFIGRTHNSTQFGGGRMAGISFASGFREINFNIDTLICGTGPLTVSFDAQGQSVTWNNGTQGSTITITESGSYWAEVAVESCVRYETDTIKVVFDEDRTSQQIFQLCAGDTAFVNTIPYTTQGVFEQRFPSAGPCDSIINIIVSVDDNFLESENYLFCEDEVIFLNNQIYPGPGIYTDTVSATNGCDTIKQINIANYPILENILGDDQQFCDTSIVLTSTLQDSYWQDSTQSNSIRVDQTGTYLLSGKDDNGCTQTDTISIAIYESQEEQLDVLVCAGDTLRINNLAYTAVQLDSQFLQTQQGCDSLLIVNVAQEGTVISNEYLLCSNEPIIINNTTYPIPGLYVDTFPTGGDCDSILLYDIALTEPIDFIPADTLYVCDPFVYLTDTVFTSIQWPDGSDKINYVITEEGTYQLSGVDGYGCEYGDEFYVQFIGEHDVYVPNIFSPNQDGTNDFFKPYFSEDIGIIEDYKFSIFDRWGALLFETNDVNERWDGIFKSKPMNVGVYTWVIRYYDPACDQERLLAGDVMIKR